MDSLEKLYRKASKNGARFLLRFDTTEEKESQWGIRYYPDPDMDANFWAEGDTIDAVVRQLLDEIEGFK